MNRDWVRQLSVKGILLLVGCLLSAFAGAEPAQPARIEPSKAVAIAREALWAGTPFLRNFGSKEYRAQSQNWALVQDRRGLIYVGNGDGVLIFDGLRWRLVPTRNRTAVRSLAVDDRGRVYVGGHGEFGYLAWNERGDPEYIPLDTKLPAGEQAFTDVWRIHALPAGPCFQSREAIFLVSAKEIRTLRTVTGFHLSFQVGEALFVQEMGRGLSRLEGGALRLLPMGERFAQDQIFLVVPWGERRGEPSRSTTELLLVGTQAKGLFLFDGKSVTPFPTEATAYLKENLLYGGTRLSDGTLALATIQGSTILLDRFGRILRLLDKRMGLQDQSVNALFQDDQSGLWLATENGISRVEIPSPLTRFGESSGLQGAIYAVDRHQGVLYAGTNYGVFRMVPGGSASETKGSPFREPAFQPIPGIKSQTWDFLPFEEALLVANQHGVYEIQGGRASLLRPSSRHSMSLYRSKRNPSRVFIGLQDGLVSIRRTTGGAGRWVDEGRFPGITEQIRTIHEDPEGRLWLGTRAQGILRVTFPGGESRGSTGTIPVAPPVIERFGVDQGLPSLNHNMVFPTRSGPVFTTHHGFFRFDESARRFIPDSRFTTLFSGESRWVFRMREDTTGRLWMHSVNETTGIRETGAAVPQLDGTFRWDTTPLRRIGDAAIEPVFPEADGVVWLGGPDGLFRLDPRIPKDYERPFNALIQRVSLGVDRPLAGARLSEGSANPVNPELKFANNTLRFEFAAPSFDLAEANRFQVLLEGRDQTWSPWMSEGFKEYTSLPERNYRFRVRAQNVHGHLSREDTFTFRILPPWYRTWGAYGVYLLVLSGLGYGFIRWRIWGLEQEKRVLEGKVEQRTEALNRKTHHLETLIAAMKSINECLDYDDLLRRILEESRVIPAVEKATALMRVPGGDRYAFRASSGWDQEALNDISLTSTEAYERYIDGAQEVLRDIFLLQNPGGRAAEAKIQNVGIPLAMVVVRVRIGGQVEGYFIFENLQDPNSFDDHAMELLSGLREPFVSAVQKARILRALHRQATDLERMNGELRLLNEQKNQFFGIVTHDLRNPLNGIVLDAQLIDGETDLQEIYHSAQNIQREGMEMSALIGRFLDVAAIESGGIKAEKEPFDIWEVASHVVDRHAASARKKGIELRMEALEGNGTASADLKFTKEVLDNLVSNAVKFSLPGKAVTVRVRGDGQKILVSVQDQGPGLTEGDKGRIFGRFARLSAQPTGGEKSTGLGLSIVKHMVEAMDGHIWVESEPGHGAVFQVELLADNPPLAGEQQGLAPPEEVEITPVLEGATHKDPVQGPEKSLPIQAFRGRVLLADDNPSNRKVEEALLRRLGIEVVGVEDGVQALEALALEPFDVVFLDGRMPRLDGASTVSEIRRRESGGDLYGGRRQPVVALTALADASGRERFLAGGFDDFLPKPLEMAALVEVLGRFLEATAPIETIQTDSWDALAGALGGPEPFAEFLTEFLQDADTRLSNLQAALTRMDRQQIERNAHDLKSNAATLRLQALSETCWKLEYGAAEMVPEELHMFINSLTGLLEEARDKCRNYLRN